MRHCKHCSKEIDFLDTKAKLTLDNEYLCSRCAKKLKYIHYPNKTYQELVEIDIQSNISNIDINSLYNDPSTKHLLKNFLFINKKLRVFGLTDREDSYVWGSLNDIVDVEYHEEVEADTIEVNKGSSGAGRAILGAVTFGVVGAFVGGLSGRKAAQYRNVKIVTSVGFNVRYRDGLIGRYNVLDVCTNYTNAYYLSELHQNVRLLSEAIISKLNHYISNKPSIETVSSFMTEIEALERLGSLRDKGILSEAEFERKKRDILTDRKH